MNINRINFLLTERYDALQRQMRDVARDMIFDITRTIDGPGYPLDLDASQKKINERLNAVSLVNASLLYLHMKDHHAELKQLLKEGRSVTFMKRCKEVWPTSLYVMNYLRRNWDSVVDYVDTIEKEYMAERRQ